MMYLFWVIFIVVLIFGVVVFIGSPYVPSRKKYIYKAFTNLYKITKKDVLVDIGSGDGVVLRQAAKLGARVIGYEINPFLVFISRLASRKDKHVQVYLANFWSAKIPDGTTVIYIFTVARDIKNLTRKLQNEVNEINRSIYLISYAGDFPGFKRIKSDGPYALYLIKPLQIQQA